MSQNTLAYTTEHPTKVETAFTFFHKYQLFSLQVEIDGKLRHLHRKVKDKAFGLFTKAKREKPLMLVFRFDPGASFNEELLQHAKILEHDMARRACQSKHVEIDQRVSSTDLFENQAMAQKEELKKPDQQTESTEVVGKNASPDICQEEVFEQRFNARHVFLGNPTGQSKTEVPLGPVTKRSADISLVSTAAEPSRKEVVDALQRMPASAWWMMALLIRICSAISMSAAPPSGESAP
jgi:hypothetical protein